MKKIIFITLAFILAACSYSCSPETELSRNQKKWEDANISHYRYNFSRECIFCVNPGYTIEIQDGGIVSVTYLDGSAITGQNWYLTIDELFSMLKSIGPVDGVFVFYDPTYGFPLRVYTRYKDVTDSDSVIEVSEFEVLP